MSGTDMKGRKAPITLIPIDGQSADAGMCIDGICALPEADPQELEAKATAPIQPSTKADADHSAETD